MAKPLASSSLGTAPDTYLYSLASTKKNTIFATIGSDNALRLFDTTLQPLRQIKAAHEGILCLQPTGAGFATAGRDGFVRLWDTNGISTGLQLAEPRGRPLSALACHNHLIAAGTESAKEGLGEVAVLLYDTRNPSVPVRSYIESHTDTITQLAFHPSQPNVLLSGSTDGLVSLFDANIEEEEDALQQVLNPRSAVHCAGFLTPSEVFVVTTDEQLAVHALSEDGAGGQSLVQEFGDVRKLLDCMYVVDFLMGQQHPIIVCGNTEKQVSTLVQLENQPSKGWSFGSAIDLPGGHEDEVVRGVLLLEGEKRAMTCGEDGCVKLWDLASTAPRAISTR